MMEFARSRSPAAPLQLQGVGEGGSAELAAPTSSSGQNLAGIALRLPVKQTGGSPVDHTPPYFRLCEVAVTAVTFGVPRRL